MIHDEHCTYEVAKLAKEKGFPQYDVDSFYEWDGLRNTHSLCNYNWYKESPYPQNFSAAPTQSLLQRWLREEKGVIVEVFVDDDSNMPLTYNIHQYKDLNWECVCHHHGNYYAVTDWELCLEDALKYALENLV